MSVDKLEGLALVAAKLRTLGDPVVSVEHRELMDTFAEEIIVCMKIRGQSFYVAERITWEALNNEGTPWALIYEKITNEIYRLVEKEMQIEEAILSGSNSPGAVSGGVFPYREWEHSYNDSPPR